MNLTRIDLSHGVAIDRSPLLHQAGIPHAFTTRRGGISSGPYHAMNLGLSCGLDPGRRAATTDGPIDSTDHIDANHRILFSAMDWAYHRHAWAHQVHGCDSVLVDVSNADERPNADALLTRTPGVVVSVRVADCVPILLADEMGQAVAAIHAGWRGVVAGVLPAAIARMERELGVTPGQLIAAVGPCIGPDHFEVGGEVAEEFDRVGLTSCVRRTTGRKPHIDLSGAARAQLAAAGIRPERTDWSDRCTFRDATDYFSHRRDQGITGRMAALLAVPALSQAAF